MEIKEVADFRNYKVSIEKAKTELGFAPQYSIKDIVADLYTNRDYYGNYDCDEFYNIRIFKKLEADSSK